jgi:hypothetical protein
MGVFEGLSVGMEVGVLVRAGLGVREAIAVAVGATVEVLLGSSV